MFKMVLRIQFQYFGSLRLIKRHCLKNYKVLFLYAMILILILKWKYDTDLYKLKDISKIQMLKLKKILPLSKENLKIKDTWRKPDAEQAAIFSAYLDLRPEVFLEEVPYASTENLWALVRIIAIIPVKDENSAMTCYYQFSSDFTNVNKSLILESSAIAVKIIASTENFGMYYSAAFVLCPLITAEDRRLPLKVTFSLKAGKKSQDFKNIDFVDIHYTTRANHLDQDKFISVCVPSLHHQYDKYVNLIEFVEFYRMMGVDHFTFYNTSISTKVSQVLSYYENIGIATVIQWKLPAQYIFERNLRYNGIFAAMNECLYRTTMIQGYRYTVNIDLDEFIVPRKYENFQEIMNHLDPVSKLNKNAVFIFRNIFYYLMYDDSLVPQSPPDIPKLLLHTKTTRWDQINPAYDRSKYIVRGQEVIEMGNHRVWKTRKTSVALRTSYRETIVDPEIAASQHYRYCEVNELVCWLRGTVVDEAAHKFTPKLGFRVKSIITEVFK